MSRTDEAQRGAGRLFNKRGWFFQGRWGASFSLWRTQGSIVGHGPAWQRTAYYGYGNGRRKPLKAFQGVANAVFWQEGSIEKSAEISVDRPTTEMSGVLNPTEIYLLRVVLGLPTEVGVLTSST